MRIEEESGIEFDFTNAISVIRHDKPLPHGDGNTIWKGVDFRIKNANAAWIWLEVKSWDPRGIILEDQESSRTDFYSKLMTKEFGAELRSKFYGTTAFLAWTGAFEPTDVTFVVLLQPPHPIDKALLGTLSESIRSAFPQKKAIWTHNLSFALADVDEWNKSYPDFRAKILEEKVPE